MKRSHSEEDDYDYDFSDDDVISYSDDEAGTSNSSCSNVFVEGDVPNMIATILNPENLKIEMQSLAMELSNFIQMRPGIAKILLARNNWNKENVLEKYYDDPERLMENCQLLAKTPSPPIENVYSECSVCCVDGPLSGLDCNHWVCSECWQMYISDKIITQNVSEIQCIFSDCNLIMDDERVLSYIVDEKTREIYEKLKTNSFVQTNLLIKWCPGIDCGLALKAIQNESKPVLCSCGTRFCFYCSKEWHDPAPCFLLNLWSKKCSDDSETSNWINANTKDCPKCHTAIEKNGGCNVMNCTASHCKAEFCWHCLKITTNHGAGHQCNKFVEETELTDDKSKARLALERYLHYYNRYANHQKSLGLEAKLVSQVDMKMERFMECEFAQNVTWIDVQSIRKAVVSLSECRKTLMYTYVFAFYVVKDNSALIFEENQKDLENATEQLSMLLERQLDDNDNDFFELKRKVQDQCHYVEQRRLVLLRHCHEGTSTDSWKYSQC